MASCPVETVANNIPPFYRDLHSHHRSRKPSEIACQLRRLLENYLRTQNESLLDSY